MSSSSGSPSEHYIEAMRLAGVVVSPGVDPAIQQSAALVGIIHALLCSAPRRARRVPAPPGRHANGGSRPRNIAWGDEESVWGYLRTGRGSGISVGSLGALVLGLLVAVAWFYIALLVAAVLVLAGIAYGVRAVARRRR